MRKKIHQYISDLMESESYTITAPANLTQEVLNFTKYYRNFILKALSYSLAYVGKENSDNALVREGFEQLAESMNMVKIHEEVGDNEKIYCIYQFKENSVMEGESNENGKYRVIYYVDSIYDYQFVYDIYYLNPDYKW